MRIIHVLFLAYLVLLPLLTQAASHDYEAPAASLVFILGILWVQVIFNCKQGRMIRFTCMDMAVIGLAIYALLNAVFSEEARVSELMGCRWAVAFALYLLARSFGEIAEKGVLSAILVSGFIQSIAGALQLAGAIPSGHSQFAVTGSFFNPGPYGGYLALAFVAGVCLLTDAIRRKTICAVLIAALGFILCMMLVSDSRAAWLAAGLASGYLLYHYYKRIIHKTNLRRYLLLASFCGAIMASGIGLYRYKKSSADVRIAVWTISGQMMRDSPVTGHGAGSFAALYMNYQSEYFGTHPASEYREWSDNRNRPFNEWIGIGCEWGCIGLLFVGAILFLAFSGRKASGLKALLLGLCVFAFFSYPFRVFPLSLFVPLILGLCHTRALCEWKIQKTAVVAAAAVSLLLIGQSVSMYRRYAAAYEGLERGKPDIRLSADTKYMSRYAKHLFDSGDYAGFIRTTTGKDFPFMTSDLACDMGIAFMRTGRTEEAERILLSAYNMVPSRVLPKYLLFRLYRDDGQTEKALQKAKEILCMKIKDAGSVYLSARTEAREYLDVYMDR